MAGPFGSRSDSSSCRALAKPCAKSRPERKRRLWVGASQAMGAHRASLQARRARGAGEACAERRAPSTHLSMFMLKQTLFANDAKCQLELCALQTRTFDRQPWRVWFHPWGQHARMAPYATRLCKPAVQPCTTTPTTGPIGCRYLSTCPSSAPRGAKTPLPKRGRSG